jgi:hypothetical protein
VAPLHAEPLSAVLDWRLPPASSGNYLSITKSIRGNIERKMRLSRESADHRRAFEEHCGGLREGRDAVTRPNNGALQDKAHATVDGAVPQVRLAAIRRQAGAAEQRGEDVRQRKLDGEWGFYRKVTDGMAEAEARYARDRLATRCSKLATAVVATNFLRALTQTVSRHAAPDAGTLARALSGSHGTLDRYLLASVQSAQTHNARLLMVRAAARLVVAGRRAHLIVAARMVKNAIKSLTPVFRALKTFHVRVVRAQAIARDFAACRNARRRLFAMHVRAAVSMLWHQGRAKQANARRRSSVAQTPPSVADDDLALLFAKHSLMFGNRFADAMAEYGRARSRAYYLRLDERNAFLARPQALGSQVKWADMEQHLDAVAKVPLRPSAPRMVDQTLLVGQVKVALASAGASGIDAGVLHQTSTEYSAVTRFERDVLALQDKREQQRGRATAARRATTKVVEEISFNPAS